MDGFSEIYYQGWKDANVSCKEVCAVSVCTSCMRTRIHVNNSIIDWSYQAMKETSLVSSKDSFRLDAFTVNVMVHSPLYIILRLLQ